MNFQKIQRAYADMRRILETANTRRGLLTDIELKTLYTALDATEEANDFGAIIYLYQRLLHLGAILDDGPMSPERQRFHFRYIRALLKTCDFETGLPHLNKALERFPSSLDLWTLQLHYLWFNRPSDLVEMARAGRFDALPSTGLIGLYGEIFILAGQHDRARELVNGANAAGQGSPDLLFLQMNSETDSARKLSAFNSYLAQNNLRPLMLRDNSQPIGIDNLVAADPDADHTSDGPLVTVITTAYECAEYLEVSARSILDQSYRNIELMLVDDCSDDATRAKIAELAAQDSRVVPVYRSENAGTYIAKSEAFRRAKGEFTIFHDSDDWAHPDKIRSEVKELRASPNLVCLGSCWVRINEDAHILMQISGNYGHPDPAATMVHTQAVLERCGTFDPIRTGADTEFKRRIQHTFGPRSLRTDRRVLVLGRQHGESLTQSGSSTMKNFGWSVPRALYRASWFDNYATGNQDRNHWSPLGVRKIPIPVQYDFSDLLKYDRLARLGLDQKFEDMIFVVRGQHAKRHLTQIHRLIMGLHHNGYRVGLWFEDKEWAHETWQGKHLRKMGHLHYYHTLDNLTGKLCLLLDSTDTGVTAQIVDPDQLQKDGTAEAPPPQTVAAFSRFLISPNWAQHMETLQQVPSEDVLVFSRPDVPGTTALQGTAFAFATQPAPKGWRNLLGSGKGQPADTLVLVHGGWSEEDMIEASMLARQLGRRFLFVDIFAEALVNHDLSREGDFTLSTPLEPAVGADLIQKIAAVIAGDYTTGQPLNTGFRLILPARGF